MMNNIVLRGEKIPKVPKLVLEQEEDRTVLVEIQAQRVQKITWLP